MEESVGAKDVQSWVRVGILMRMREKGRGMPIEWKVQVKRRERRER